MPAAEHGLTILPYWAGERSPGYADYARATISGMTLHTTPLHILQAILEAVEQSAGSRAWVACRSSAACVNRAVSPPIVVAITAADCTACAARASASRRCGP